LHFSAVAWYAAICCCTIDPADFSLASEEAPDPEPDSDPEPDPPELQAAPTTDSEASAAKVHHRCPRPRFTIGNGRRRSLDS
jgi:hypothetical protein